MVYAYNNKHLRFSRLNRRNQTEAEKRLWFHTRNRQLKGHKFHRQFPVGNYILDFYCHEKKLAIELDGSQHMCQNSYDKRRELFLANIGIKVLRFWDNEVLQNTNEVLEKIINKLEGEAEKDLA